jgi:hypothetical protein
VIGTVLLYIERGDGAAIAQRALVRGEVRMASFDGRRQRAVPVKLVDAREDRIVRVADLIDAAPLTAAEEAEYRRLDAQLAGTIGEARTLKRFNALRLRSLMFGDER